MSLELFLHPLSSYCHKVLIAFYENEVPFEVKRIDDPAVAREYEALSPLRKFPILRDLAAAPAIFYGNRFYGPFRETHPNALAYLDRLMARPSYARVLEEAKPFMHLLPK